jgi:hypothetical protein
MAKKAKVVDPKNPAEGQPFVSIPLPADQANHKESTDKIKAALSKGRMVVIPDFEPDHPITGWDEESFVALFYDLNIAVTVQGKSPDSNSNIFILTPNSLDTGLRHEDPEFPHVTTTLNTFRADGYNHKKCQNLLENIQSLDTRPWFMR